MILRKNLVLDDFFKYYYLVLNSVLNLTNTELNIISEIARIRHNLGNSMSEDEKNRYTLSTTSRQIICDNLNISKYNLNNYIKSLRTKGMLVLTDGQYTLSPQLLIDPSKEVTITFKLNIK